MIRIFMNREKYRQLIGRQKILILFAKWGIFRQIPESRAISAIYPGLSCFVLAQNMTVLGILLRGRQRSLMTSLAEVLSDTLFTRAGDLPIILCKFIAAESFRISDLSERFSVLEPCHTLNVRGTTAIVGYARGIPFQNCGTTAPARKNLVDSFSQAIVFLALLFSCF